MTRPNFTTAHPQVLAALRADATIPEAAAKVGLSTKAVQGWLTRGRREESGEYWLFAQAVDAMRRGREITEPMTLDELLVVVSRAADAGSVQAMRLRWEMIRADQEPEEALDPIEDLDQLAQCRQARQPDRAAAV